MVPIFQRVGLAKWNTDGKVVDGVSCKPKTDECVILVVVWSRNRTWMEDVVSEFGGYSQTVFESTPENCGNESVQPAPG